MSADRCAYPDCGEREKAGFNGALVVLKGPVAGWWCAQHKDAARAEMRRWLSTQAGWRPPPPKIPKKAPPGWKTPE